MDLEAGLDNEPEHDEGPDLDTIISEIEMDYLPPSRLVSLLTFPINMAKATKEFLGGIYEQLSQLKGLYEAWRNRSENMMKNIYH